MEFEPPTIPWRQRLKRPLAWIVAGGIGLLVSIADVKLPAETVFVPPAPDGADVSALPAGLGRPAGEPEPFLHLPELLPAAHPEAPRGEPAFDPLDLIIHEAAGRYDVDFNLIRAIISAESRFNAQARSKRGARGMMQLMPETASALEVDDIEDPGENIDAGVRYFRMLLDRFDGDVALALAAYNAGPRKVLRHDGIPPYRETRSFISRVLDRYANPNDTLQ
jgi:hypothetical protein